MGSCAGDKPAQLCIKVRAGSTKPTVLRFTTPEGEFDLTGWTVEAHARQRRSGSDPPVVRAVATLDSDDKGRVYLLWPVEEKRAAVADRDVWQGFYDVRVTGGPNGDTVYLVEGTYTIEQDVTR